MHPNVQVFGLFSTIISELPALEQINFISFFFSIHQNIYKQSFLVAGDSFIDLFMNGNKIGMNDIQMLFISISNMKCDALKEILSQKLSFLYENSLTN